MDGIKNESDVITNIAKQLDRVRICCCDFEEHVFLWVLYLFISLNMI